MSEIERPIQAVEVNRQCDKCKKGLMVRRDSMALVSAPPMYWHKCTHVDCDHEEIFRKSYPAIEFKS